MLIGILQTGLCPPDLVDRHGEYDEMFSRFLGGHDFEFRGYRVVEGEMPSCVNSADGWLITGSRHGAYEKHDWILPLEKFIRGAFNQMIPVVGICFGHQILAQALGGRVEKFSGGWVVGKQHYEFDGIEGGIDLMAWHQDQVMTLPEGASVIASSSACKYAGIDYGNNAMSFQPHPEFGEAFVTDLFEARKDVLPKEVMVRQSDDHSGKLDTGLIANRLASVLKRQYR